MLEPTDPLYFCSCGNKAILWEKGVPRCKNCFKLKYHTLEEEKIIRQEILDSCLQASDRRVWLGKMMNEHDLGCPDCGTRQVQLTGYINIQPAQWKCRHCKHEFTWEVGYD